MKINVGDKIPALSLETVFGSTQAVPDPSRKFTHLQFRRFAGCPICNFHLRTFTRSADALANAGITEVIMFHSSADEMRKFQADLPFAVVADPEKKLYKQFGVETSWWASLHPRALWAALKGILLGKLGLKMENGPIGLPADILLDRSGTVVAVKYGTHAYDQWELAELLAKTSSGGGPPQAGGARQGVTERIQERR